MLGHLASKAQILMTSWKTYLEKKFTHQKWFSYLNSIISKIGYCFGFTERASRLIGSAIVHTILEYKLTLIEVDIIKILF